MKLNTHPVRPALAFAVVVLAAGTLGFGLEPGMGPTSPLAAGRQEGFSYDGYAALLKAYVDEQGMVNYRGLKADGDGLNAFAEAMGRLDPRTYEQWSERQKVAFWLNAYNALTLKAIIDNYPIKPTFPARLRHPRNSIRQIKGVWTKLKFRVMGEMTTLDAIEHEVLRKEFAEPRIHVALVCAAMGCPPLRNEPYRGEALDEQLGDQARQFLANREKFHIDRGKGRVYISPILKWFGEDFVKAYGTTTEFAGQGETERAVLNYISRHLNEQDRRYLATGKYKIKYLDYDWSLNKQKPEPR